MQKYLFNYNYVVWNIVINDEILNSETEGHNIPFGHSFDLGLKIIHFIQN